MVRRQRYPSGARSAADLSPKYCLSVGGSAPVDAYYLQAESGEMPSPTVADTTQATTLPSLSMPATNLMGSPARTGSGAA